MNIKKIERSEAQQLYLSYIIRHLKRKQVLPLEGPSPNAPLHLQKMELNRTTYARTMADIRTSPAIDFKVHPETLYPNNPPQVITFYVNDPRYEPRSSPPRSSIANFKISNKIPDTEEKIPKSLMIKAIAVEEIEVMHALFENNLMIPAPIDIKIIITILDLMIAGNAHGIYLPRSIQGV